MDGVSGDEMGYKPLVDLVDVGIYRYGPREKQDRAHGRAVQVDPGFSEEQEEEEARERRSGSS